MKSGMGSLIGIVVVAVGLLIWTILAGNSPLLGLDLRGGVEVVLRPADDPDNLDLARQEGNLERAAQIIRQRVDAIGVAEPDVTVQNLDIVVQLPGVEDQERAVDLVGQTAELRFRPVIYPAIQLGSFPQALQAYEATVGGIDRPVDDILGDVVELVTNAGGVAAGTADADTDDSDSDTSDAEGDGEDETGLSLLVPGGETAAALQDDGTPVDPLEALQDDGTPADPLEALQDQLDPTGNTLDIDATDLNDMSAEELQELLQGGGDFGTSPFAQNTAVAGTGTCGAAANVNLFELEGVNGGAGSADLFNFRLATAATDNEDQSIVATDGRCVYLLGPTLYTGAALQGAEAQALGAGNWNIGVEFKEGAQGTDLLNNAADLCYNARPECSTGGLAIVLDRNVNSVVGFETPVFEDTRIQISRGAGGYTAEEARDTALVLDFGALPIEFEDPNTTGLVRGVSSTLGEGSLNAGLLAGAIGLLLVALYMLWYYRALGLAALLSLAVSATLLYVIVSYLSASRGLALTLAGIVGLIVSIGVSLDSNVVYFEHLKEDIHAGRTLRSATDRAFPVAFKTVFWANMATLIGAAILYFLTVGSVKGFAVMLGIASVLDLVATYFFMRPFVHWLAHSKWVADRPGLFGMGMSGKAVEA